MSAVRVYIDGRPTWRKADDGAVGRMSAMGSIRGSFVVGESERDRILRVTHEQLDAMDATVMDSLAKAAKAAKSAAQAAYYQRNKQRVLDAQRAKRQAYKRDMA